VSYQRRHCERSEAIQSQEGNLDCFVAFTPRNDALKAVSPIDGRHASASCGRFVCPAEPTS
jgi:hypothetical protein